MNYVPPPDSLEQIAADIENCDLVNPRVAMNRTKELLEKLLSTVAPKQQMLGFIVAMRRVGAICSERRIMPGDLTRLCEEYAKEIGVNLPADDSK